MCDDGFPAASRTHQDSITRLKDIGRCPQCGYFTRGMAPVHQCPECGMQLEADAVIFRPRGWQRIFVLAMGCVSMALLMFVSIIGLRQGSQAASVGSILACVCLALATWPILRFIVHRKCQEYVMLTSAGITVQLRHKPRLEIPWGKVRQVSPNPFLDLVIIALDGHLHSIPGYFRPKGWSVDRFAKYLIGSTADASLTTHQPRQEN